MNKKFLSLVLALVMVLGTFGSVFAETKAPEAKDAKKSEVKVPEKKETNEKVQWLVDNGVVAGRTVNKDDKNADLALDKDIQRAEVTKLLIYAIGQQDLAKRLDGVYAPYKDVPSNHWANGLISAGSTVASPANALPFLHGIGHNMFEPERQVRYDELAKMLVVLVKKDLTKAGLEAAKWPTDWMNWAAQLGIFDGIKTPVDGSKAAVRSDAFVMLYNALYKMGQLRNLPANETMGIISDANANKIVLNQGDFKKEFTVTANTNFVPGTYTKADRATVKPITWYNAIASAGDYYVGSLVRVIADEKGNVSHIVQLGNPEQQALASNGWVGVAHETIETVPAATGVAEVKATFKEHKLDTIIFAAGAKQTKVVNQVGTEEKTTKDISIDTNSKTRYFVADYAKKQLTEVKDQAAALKLFDRKRIDSNKVYVGYDVLANSGIKEAKVVVFGDVDENNWTSELVRIVTAGTNSYKVTAQKSGYNPTEEKGYDLRSYKAAFPLAYGLNPYDVVELAEDMTLERVIDYKTHDTFLVNDINPEQLDGQDKVNGRIVQLELKDEDGLKQVVDVKIDTDFWFANSAILHKGAKVQVRFVKTNDMTTAVDLVSVVPEKTKLKGTLPRGIEENRETGLAKDIVKKSDANGYFFQFSIYKPNETGDRVVATYVTRDNMDAIKAGDEITFVWNAPKYEAHGLRLASNVEKTAKQVAKEAAQKELDKLNTPTAEFPKGKKADEKNVTFTFNPAAPKGSEVSYTLNSDGTVTVTVTKDGASKTFKNVAVSEAK